MNALVQVTAQEAKQNISRLEVKIILPLAKIILMPGHSSYDHWVAELRRHFKTVILSGSSIKGNEILSIDETDDVLAMLLAALPTALTVPPENLPHRFAELADHQYTPLPDAFRYIELVDSLPLILHQAFFAAKFSLDKATSVFVDQLLQEILPRAE